MGCRLRVFRALGFFGFSGLRFEGLGFSRFKFRGIGFEGVRVSGFCGCRGVKALRLELRALVL